METIEWLTNRLKTARSELKKAQTEVEMIYKLLEIARAAEEKKERVNNPQPPKFRPVNISSFYPVNKTVRRYIEQTFVDGMTVLEVAKHIRKDLKVSCHHSALRKYMESKYKKRLGSVSLQEIAEADVSQVQEENKGKSTQQQIDESPFLEMVVSEKTTKLLDSIKEVPLDIPQYVVASIDDSISNLVKVQLKVQQKQDVDQREAIQKQIEDWKKSANFVDCAQPGVKMVTLQTCEAYQRNWRESREFTSKMRLNACRECKNKKEDLVCQPSTGTQPKSNAW